MTEVKDNSSLPLLLSISGAVLAVAVGGWFYLDQETPAPAATPESLAATRTAGMITTITEEPLPMPVVTTEDESAADPDSVPVQESVPEENPDLRLARLAAEADILIFPPDQSALHYYGLVLESNPRHAAANAELDAMLSKVAQTVRQHLAAEEYAEAYEIAGLVVGQRPDHALVVETQQTLDDHTERLVAEAIEHAQAGKDDEAARVLAIAQALPGRNPDYFTAVRDSIAEIQEVRRAAERDRARRAQLANEQARDAWVASIRSAIADGNLIAPAGASARDLLAESNQWEGERAQLTGELRTALVDTTALYINERRLDEAEALLNAAAAFSDDPEGLGELNIALENAFIEAKSQRIAQITELVRVKAEPPRYPRNAQRLSVSGWVDVYFTVTPDGRTADVVVDRSDPESIFDRAAINAVEQWEFQPVEYRGRIISQRAATRVVFRIQ